MSINNRNFWLCFRIPCSSERYRPVLKSYFRNVHICIFVFEITDVHFDDIKNFWFHQLKNAENNNIIRALVGSKCDLS